MLVTAFRLSFCGAFISSCFAWVVLASFLVNANSPGERPTERSDRGRELGLFVPFLNVNECWKVNGLSEDSAEQCWSEGRSGVE